nr:MAG TPA: hypothetical protein [Caudoviricetes sp.]
MLVNISEDILELIKFDEFENSENTKKQIENTVNMYLLGGMLAASKNGEIDVKEEDILSLMEFYEQKIRVHILKIMLSKDFKGGYMI